MFKICVLHLSPNTVFALVPLVSCVKEFPVVRVTVAPSTTCLITVASLVKPSLNNDLFAGADTPITDLGSLVVTTIEGGLSARPAFVDTGAGYIKFPGNYDSSDILLITNTDSNEVIYAFNDTNSGGLTELATSFVSTNDYAYTEDEDFPKYLQTTDAITRVYLNKNTASMLAQDKLQIYVDTDELIVRPYEFRTDAIERNRTAELIA